MRAVLLVLALAGCAGAPASDDSVCNAENWQGLVGQPEEALYGALANLRVVRAGAPVTKDYNRDRLNASIGPDGKITGFGCY